MNTMCNEMHTSMCKMCTSNYAHVRNYLNKLIKFLLLGKYCKRVRAGSKLYWRASYLAQVLAHS